MVLNITLFHTRKSTGQATLYCSFWFPLRRVMRDLLDILTWFSNLHFFTLTKKAPDIRWGIVSFNCRFSWEISRHWNSTFKHSRLRNKTAKEPGFIKNSYYQITSDHQNHLHYKCDFYNSTVFPTLLANTGGLGVYPG